MYSMHPSCARKCNQSSVLFPRAFSCDSSIEGAGAVRRCGGNCRVEDRTSGSGAEVVSLERLASCWEGDGSFWLEGRLDPFLAGRGGGSLPACWEVVNLRSPLAGRLGVFGRLVSLTLAAGVPRIRICSMSSSNPCRHKISKAGHRDSSELSTSIELISAVHASAAPAEFP